jgi:hypothetical protein
LDELQFDLGEGPCWDALRDRRPILEPDIRRSPFRHWPAFTPAVIEQGVAALFAFPLAVGPLQIGAVDMYSRVPVVLSRQETQHAVRLADLVARRVLVRALGSSEQAAEGPADSQYSRRIVHQATGMVLAQLSIGADDAYLVIQAHAYSTNRTMMEVSRQILSGELDFGDSDNRDESQP